MVGRDHPDSDDLDDRPTGYRSDMAHSHPYLDHSGPLAIAHRGGAGVHPENTERAFRHAVDLGFTHIETDVHVTADGVVVAFHDDDLDRVTDREGTIAELKWSEVSQARVSGTEPVCRLDDLLSAFPDTRFNLDPKHDAAIEPLAAVILAANAQRRVCVGSFSDRRADRLRRLVGPELCTATGVRRALFLWLRGWDLPMRHRHALVAQVPVRRGFLEVVTPRFIDAAHRCGVHVHVWTIDDPAEIGRLLDLGVDGIMTDRPEVLRRVYVERGAWSEG